MYNATLTSLTVLSTQCLKLEIRPDSGVPRFTAGQYVTLGLLGEEGNAKSLVQQVYSIASPPEQKDCLEFYVVVIDNGMLTSRLEKLRAGDRLFVSPRAKGTFTLREVPSLANLCLIATGTGVAPFMSMLRSQEIWAGRRKILLVHGVRYAADLAYRSALEELSLEKPEFSYYPIVSRDLNGWSGRRGRVQVYLDQGIIAPDPKADYVFLAGNPGMVGDMALRLCKAGFVPRRQQQPGNLYLEQHWEDKLDALGCGCGSCACRTKIL